MFYWYSLCALSACSALKTQSSFHAQTDEGKCCDQAPPPPPVYTKRKGDSFLSRAPVYAGRRTYLPTYVRSTVLHGGGRPRRRRRRLVVRTRRRAPPIGAQRAAATTANHPFPSFSRCQVQERAKSARFAEQTAFACCT